MAKGAKNPRMLPRLRGSVVPRIGLFVAVFLGVSVYVMSRISDIELNEVAPYILVAIAVQFVPFLVRLEPDPFEPASLTSVMTLLALVPCLTSFMVNNSVSINLLPQVTGRARIELVQTIMISYIVGTICYYIGYYRSTGKRLQRTFPDVAGGEWPRGRILFVCLVSAGIFIPAYAYFQNRVGVRLTDVTQLNAGKQVWQDDTTKSWLMRAIGIGFVSPLVLLSLNFPKWRWIRGLTVIGVLFVIGFLATRLGSRGLALYWTLNALIVIHYLGRKIPMTVLGAVAFVMLVVTNLLGEYRSRVDDSTASNPGPTANFDAAETLAEHDDDRQRLSAMAVVFYFFPERRDYLMGESWGPVLTAFIPRWLWPEKREHFHMRDTGIVWELVGAPVPVNYLGLLYANFSWIGIVLGMMGWGAYQRAVYEWLLRHNKDRGVVLLYSCYILYVGPTMLQLAATIGYVLPMWAALKFMRKLPKAVKARALAKKPGEPAAPLLLGPAPAPAAAQAAPAAAQAAPAAE
jgi:hypothetical protein